MAGFFQGVTTVAFYDTLGSDAMRFMCNQTELTTVAMSEEMVGKFSKLKTQDAEADEHKMYRVKNLVVFEDTVTNENKELAEKAGLNIYHFNALMAKGAELKAAGTAPAVQEPNKEDVYMFSYTSGTTGDPKGV
jgi:long-chain acyl-CoA synthetase